MQNYVKKLTESLLETILSKGVRDMPQNPAAQGFDERQIRAFYYLPEQAILELVMEIEESLVEVFTDIRDGKVNVSDIVNALTSTATNKPLSANMGRLLNQYISNEATTRANQDNLRVKYADVVNNLASEEITKPLSAKQGAVLNGKVTEVDSKVQERTKIYLTADEEGFVYVNEVGDNG